MIWWPPYRRRITAEAEELMEHYGDQALNAASRLRTTARKNREFRRVLFYHHVERYLVRFVDIAQMPYQSQGDDLMVEVIDRISKSKTLH